MPHPLSRRHSRLFVALFVIALAAFIAVASYFITRGMNDQELQDRIRDSREAREAGREE